jgi:hypothetical protein
MPIYLGGTRIDSLKLGGTNIGSGFLGTVKVFGAAGPAATYADEVAADSPFAWWRMEETSGTNVADEQGGHNGTTSGSPDLNVAGPVGSAIDLVGSSSQRVGVGTLGTFGSSVMPTTSDGLTVELWAKWTSTTLMSALGTYNTGTSTQSLDIQLQNGRATAFFRSENNSFVQRATARSDLNDGLWHHLAAVFTRPGNVIDCTIYVDGVADNGTVTKQDRTWSAADFGYPLQLGARNVRGSIQDHLTGGLDEVALYLSGLSSTRVAAHYAAA